jgi:hypothetical protein
MKSLRASLTLAIACAILACVNVSAGAQSANTRIIVPFAAGSVLGALSSTFAYPLIAVIVAPLSSMKRTGLPFMSTMSQ